MEDLNYWDLIAFLNIDLCFLLVIEDEKTDEKWDEIILNFKSIWLKAGSIAKKAEELEHIDFITHSLNMVAGVDGEAYSPNKDLDTRIGELKIALGNVRNKLRSQRSDNPIVSKKKEGKAPNKKSKSLSNSGSKNN